MKFTVSIPDLARISVFMAFLALFSIIDIVLSAETSTGTVPLNFTVAQLLSVTKSTELTNGILFGNVNPSTVGNPARNNSNFGNNGGIGNSTAYNWTVDSSSTSNAAFYNKLNAPITCTGGNCYYNVSGSSTGNYTTFSANTTFSSSGYTLITNCNNIAAAGNCWAKYYLDVSSGVSAGTYGGATNYAYCVNATTGSTAC